MKYNELRIRVSRELIEQVEAVLIGDGFVSMMIDDPDDVLDILEHPDTYRYDYINEELKADLSRDPVITLYFADDDEGACEMKRASDLIGRYAAELGRSGPEGESCRIRVESDQAGDDSEWLYKWQEFFKPTRVGERIVVKPSWEDYVPAEKDLVIEMDPGMAFGSGLHETTSMCIKALERIVSQENAGTRRVLDVGCGTGILAIASALLGADECLGIDIDPDAVRVAQENIRKNGLEDCISAQLGDLTEGVDFEADIVVANLMADLVIRLSPAAADHLSGGGWYITSGILDIKEDVVCKAIRDAGFAVIDVLADGEWRAVVARRQQ